PIKLAKLPRKSSAIKLDTKRTFPKVRYSYTLLEEEVTPVKYVTVEKIKSPIKIRKFTKIYVIPSDYKKRTIPKVQYKYALLPDDSKPNNISTTNTTKPNTTPKVQPNNIPDEPPKDMQFNVKTEVADKTYIKVYIVNKQG